MWMFFETSLSSVCENLGIRSAICTTIALSGANLLIGISFRGWVEFRLNHLPIAEALTQESLALGYEIEDRWIIANALHSLGILSLRQGDYHSASLQFEQALPRWRDIPHWVNVALSLRGLGEAMLLSGVACDSRLSQGDAVWSTEGSKKGFPTKQRGPANGGVKV